MSALGQYFHGIRIRGRKIYVGTTGAVITIDRVFLTDLKACLLYTSPSPRDS